VDNKNTFAEEFILDIANVFSGGDGEFLSN
jgi:hypothetical protein